MGLIIGGSIASASILTIIMIVAMSGGEKKSPKKERLAPPTVKKNTGPQIDQARLNQGIVKCEKAYGLYRNLKNRMHNRSGMSTSELNRLRKDLEDVDRKLQAGLADIEFSNGTASVTAYQKAHKDMKMVLMELK